MYRGLEWESISGMGAIKKDFNRKEEEGFEHQSKKAKKVGVTLMVEVVIKS